MISVSDIVAFGAELRPLNKHTVAEAMTRSVFSLPPSASVREAARMMERQGVHRILVLEEGVLIGIVTSLDIVRAVADGAAEVLLPATAEQHSTPVRAHPVMLPGRLAEVPS